jgi:hypothetical protein
MVPAIKHVKFWIIIAMKVVINPFTVLQSEASLAESEPLLFLGLSNHEMGIFNILE